MNRSTITTFLICTVLIGCSNGQAKKNATITSQQSKPMDNFQFTFESAHPNAQALMKDEFYFSPVAETGPFGSDDGWDAAYSFRQWRFSNKSTSPVVFLKNLIAGWQYPYFDYNEMDTSKILAYIDQKKELSEAEIQKQISILKEVNKNSPDTSYLKLDDQQLREVILSSSQGMNNIFLLGQDNAIIGIGFAQFVLEGRIDRDIKGLTLTAIQRQLLPILINRYDNDYREIRRQQLLKMLEVINKVGS